MIFAGGEAAAAAVSPVFAITSVVSALVVLVGGITAVVKWRPEINSLRATAAHAAAQARQADATAEVARDARDDEHWSELVRTQTEVIVAPLREEVVVLRDKVTVLQDEVETLRTRYWRVVVYARALLRWIGKHFPEGPTDLPAPHGDIVADL